MGQIRRRESAEIRALALETAAQKYAEGCVSCAQSYLDLAREYGASARELAQVSERATDAQPAGLDRRRLFRIAATAVAAGVAGNFLLAGQAKAAPKPFPGNDQNIPIPGFFGVDSCTSPKRGMVASMPMQYYIGELGATQYNAGCFDHTTAKQVTAAYTHGYWGVCGPNAMPDGLGDLGLWGQQQALAAIDAWNNNPYVGGRTLFADIESGFGGWGKPATQADHVALLNGFLQAITQAGFIPGLYINHSERAAYFPADYVAPAPFVYWVAGGKLAGTMAGPCQQGDTLHPTVTAWTSSVQQETFGGMQAVLWQYWLSGMGCGGDFNYSPQSGYSTFLPLPVASQTTPDATGAGTPTPTPVATVPATSGS
jgi:hypothetical protein